MKLPVSSHSLTSYLLVESESLDINTGCNYAVVGTGGLLMMVGAKTVQDNRSKKLNKNRNKTLAGIAMILLGGSLVYCGVRK